jgi:hypothetical protein
MITKQINCKKRIKIVMKTISKITKISTYLEIVILTVLLSMPVLSYPEGISRDVDVALSAGISQDDADVQQLVEDQIDHYLKSPDISPLRERGDIYLNYAIEEIPVGPENKSWAKHRVVAYERAFIEAQNRFISSQGIEIKEKTIKELYSNASGNIPKFDKKDINIPEKYRQTLSKIIAYAEGRLEQELEKLGINLSDFSSAQETQRTTMLRDALEKTTFTKAIGSLVGLVPLKTFEGQNSKRHHAIGVVVIYSPKIKQFTHDILHSRGNIQPKDKIGQPLFERISKNKDTLYNDFGVRQVVDEKGYPALISFGQWSNAAITRDDRLQRRYREIAQKQARSIADNAIATFLAGSAVYDSESTVGNSIEQHFDVDSTDYIEEVILKDIIDSLREESRNRAKVNVVGLRDLYKWTMKHPLYEHEIVGVVRVWGPQSEREARDLKNWKPIPRIEKTEKSGREMTTPETKVIGGNDYMKPEDF